MSMVLGFRLPDRIVLAADSLTTIQMKAVPATAKLRVRCGALVGHVGSGSTEYLYWHGVAPDADVLAPRFHLERWAAYRETKEAANPRVTLTDMELSMVIARDRALIEVNGEGEVFEVGAYTALGDSWLVANYLIAQQWRPDYTVAECVALAASVIAAVAQQDRAVALPVVWADTRDLIVRTLGE